MDAMVEWIAAHALALWLALALLALVGADLAWRYNARWRRRALANGHPLVVLRWPMGVALLVSLLLFFSGVAIAIFARESAALSRFDTTLAEQLRVHMPQAWLRFIAWITHLGGPWFVASAAVAIAIYLAWRRHWQLTAVWVATMACIVPINSGIKALFQRSRPLHEHGYVIESGWSFPSGHAFGAMVFYGLLTYVLLKRVPAHLHRRIVAAAAVMIALIGLSRVLLQVHYVSDVFAGYAAGAAWLVLCIGCAERWALPSRHASPPENSQ